MFVDIPENRCKKEATIATNDWLITDQSLFENCLMEMEECFNPSVGEWFKCLDIKIPSEMEVAPSTASIMGFLSYQTIGFLNNQTDSHGPILYLEG